MISNRGYKGMLTTLGLDIKDPKPRDKKCTIQPKRYNYCEGLQREVYTRKPEQLHKMSDFDTWIDQLRAFQDQKKVTDLCLAAIEGVILYICDYATPCSVASRSRAASTKRIKNMNAIIETCTNKHESDSDKYLKIKYTFDQMDKGLFGGSKLRDYVYKQLCPIISKACNEPVSLCPFVLC